LNYDNLLIISLIDAKAIIGELFLPLLLIY